MSATKSPIIEKRIATTLLLIIISLSKASAQGGPPLLTDDPGTPGDGKWEINIAATVEQRPSQRQWEAPLIDINYGVGERIQLKYELPLAILEQRDTPTLAGLGNSLLGVKWRFFDEEKQGVATSVYPQLELNNPTTSAERGLVENGKSFLLPIEFARHLDSFEVNLEIGYQFVEFTTDRWVYGFAIGYPVSEKFELLSEVHGLAERKFKNDELVINIGARWELDKNFSLLFSVGRGVRDSMEGELDLRAYLGTQLHF